MLQMDCEIQERPVTNGHDEPTVVDLARTELELCDPLDGSNVFVLGNTGAGKSTLLQWINGADFEIVEPENLFGSDPLILQPVNNSALDPRFGIGHQMKSCTANVQSLKLGSELGGKPLSFVDTPGFIDTEGKTTDLLNFLKTRHAMYVSEENRFVLLTDCSVLAAGRGAGIITMLDRAAELLGVDKSNLDQLPLLKSCLFLFTHAPPQKSLQDCKKIIKHIIEKRARY